MTCRAESGTCPKCQSGCQRFPGWFAPGEAERAADLLGVSLAELFRTRLTVDYWVADDRLSPTTYLLAPATVENAAGGVSGIDKRGTCTFFKEGRCEIHEAKPLECRQWWCGADSSDLVPHHEVARRWQPHQQQVLGLLGAKPAIPTPTVGDLLNVALGALDDALGQS